MSALPSVPSRSNAFGAYELQAGTWTYRFGGGPVYVVPYYDIGSRQFPSYNPESQNIAGGRWRYPSRYHRRVLRFDDVVSTGFNLYGSYPTELLLGGDQNGLYLTSPVAGWWTIWGQEEDSNLIAESTTNALLKLNNKKASWGTALAESSKTFDHLVRTVVDLFTAYRHARRGNWKAVGKSLGLTKDQVLLGRFPANRWLEYQYGWKPLLKDIHDIYGILQGQIACPLVLSSKGFAKRGFNHVNVPYLDNNIWYNASTKAEQICQVKLYAELDSLAWRTASQLDLVNPLSIGWELVPFSFVLDWFMPVGNMLEALTARAGLKFVSGSRTYVTSGTKEFRSYWTAWGAPWRPGGVTMRSYCLDRVPLYDWPSPALYVDNSPFSTVRSLNALALWRTNIRRV